MTPAQLKRLFLSDLSDDEEIAFRTYKSDDGALGSNPCTELNAALRNGLFPDELPNHRQMMDHLDHVFRRCPTLTEPLTVYRGVSHRSFLWNDTLPHLFRSFEYWSTTVTQSASHRFIRRDGGALMELALPAGLPVYNMETLPGAGGAEAELLLPRGILWEMRDLPTQLGAEEVRSILQGKPGALVFARLTAVSATPRALN